MNRHHFGLITKARVGWCASMRYRSGDPEIPEWVTFDLIGTATSPWRLTRKGIERVVARRARRWDAEAARRAAAYEFVPPTGSRAAVASPVAPQPGENNTRP